MATRCGVPGRLPTCRQVRATRDRARRLKIGQRRIPYQRAAWAPQSLKSVKTPRSGIGPFSSSVRRMSPITSSLSKWCRSAVQATPCVSSAHNSRVTGPLNNQKRMWPCRSRLCWIASEVAQAHSTTR
eukprot:scaffold28288_cov127-Isochrysis_galbana.AAC.5